MLDRCETKEDDLHPCIPQVTAILEVLMRVPSLGVALTLPLYTCVLRAQSTNASVTGRVTDLLACGGRGVVELFGQAARPVEPKAVSAKVRAAHHAFLARCGLNAVQVDS
jgi:hypothetical protein